MASGGAEMTPADLAAFLANFRPDGATTFVGIIPDGGTVAKTFNGSAPDATAWIEKVNVRRNVYFTLNATAASLGKKPTKAEITAIHAGHSDVDPRDDAPLEAERDRLTIGLASDLMALSWPPSFIVDSGNGIQPIWQLVEAVPATAETIAAIEVLNRRLEAALGAKGTHNVDRLLRVPGTRNYPNKRKLALGRPVAEARLLAATWRRYTWDDIEDLAAHLEDEPLEHAWAQTDGNGAAKPDPTPEPPDDPDFDLNPDVTLRQRLEAFLTRNPDANALWHETEKPKGADQSRSAQMLAIAGLLARHLSWTRTQIEHALSLWCRERGHLDKLGREVERTAEKALGDLAAERQQQPEFETAAETAARLAKKAEWLAPLDIIGAPELVGWPTLTEDCLPEPLYRYVMVEAERLNVDPCPLAAHVIAACATACNDAWRIKPKLNDHWTQQARIWTCAVKAVGARGTDTIRSAFWPVHKREAELREVWQREMTLWEARQQSRKKGDPPDPQPVCQRITTQDATIEAAAQLLANGNQHSKLTVLCDELVAFLGSFGRYDSKGSSTRAVWLESYDGGPKRIDRIIRGHVFVPNWSVIAAGNIQPRKLTGMANDLVDDGLFQRFTTIHTKPSDVGLDDDPPLNADAGCEYCDLYKALSGLMPSISTADGGGFALVRFDADARSVRRAFKPLIERLTVDPAMPIIIRESAPKWSGLLARLALIFHLVEVAEAIRRNQPSRDRYTANGPTVTKAGTFIRRIVLPNLFRLGFETMPETGAPDAHARWIAGHVLAHRLGQISARDIGRAYRPLRGKAEDIALAMAVLVDAGWARLAEGRHDGMRWDVNPAVHTVFAQAAAAEKARREAVMAALVHKVSDL